MEDLKSRLGIIDGQIKQLETRAATQDRDILELSIRPPEPDRRVPARHQIQRTAIQPEWRDSLRRHRPGGQVLVTTGIVHASRRGANLHGDVGCGSKPNQCSYLTIADAKKVEPGMQVQVTPDLVERQRFGGILGSVVSVGSTAATRGTRHETDRQRRGSPVAPFRRRAHRSDRRAENDPSTFSRSKWSSSKGPNLRISVGPPLPRAFVLRTAPPSLTCFPSCWNLRDLLMKTPCPLPLPDGREPRSFSRWKRRKVEPRRSASCSPITGRSCLSRYCDAIAVSPGMAAMYRMFSRPRRPTAWSPKLSKRMPAD